MGIGYRNVNHKMDDMNDIIFWIVGKHPRETQKHYYSFVHDSEYRWFAFRFAPDEYHFREIIEKYNKELEK